MRFLVLDSALARCTAALVAGDVVLASRSEARDQGHEAVGHEAVLPAMARAVLHGTPATGNQPSLDAVAVTVGPGSFTGIRAGLALAHGIGLALGIPVIGVTVGEAIADAFPHLGERSLWVVTDSRRGHIFLETATATVSLSLDALPHSPGRLAIAGGAALQVASRLAARGTNVMLTDARFPLPRHIASIAARRHGGTLPPRAPQPLYVDPPEARPPATPPRPPPAVSGQ